MPPLPHVCKSRATLAKGRNVGNGNAGGGGIPVLAGRTGDSSG